MVTGERDIARPACDISMMGFPDDTVNLTCMG